MSSLGKCGAAAALLGGLLAFGGLLAPHWRRHLAFERVVGGFAQQAEGGQVPVDLSHTRAQSQGARPLDVRAGPLRLRRTDYGLRLEVRYPAGTGVAFYTADLNFRAKPGR